MRNPPIFKICVFGNSGVGKSTLISKYFKEFKNESLEVPPKVTIGVTFYQGTLDVGSTEVKLQIWVLTDKEKFKDIYYYYVKGAAGGIFVYDITDKSSLKDLDNWLKIFKRSKRNVSLPILMIGNKVDLQDERKISIQHASKLASDKNLIGTIELSSMDSKAVKSTFIAFSKIIMSVDPKRHLVDIFRNEFNLRLLILFNVFKELSLKEISYHLGKSKAHISRRTRELIRSGLLETYTKDDEIQPGNIKRNYYTLSKNFSTIMQKKQIDLHDIIKHKNWDPILENMTKPSYEYKIIKMISDHLNSSIEAIENLLLTSVAMEKSSMIETIEVLLEALESRLINFHYLSEDQHAKVVDLSSEFHKELAEILKTDDSSEKSYLYVDILLPIINVVKFGSKATKYLLGLRPHEKEYQKLV